MNRILHTVSFCAVVFSALYSNGVMAQCNIAPEGPSPAHPSACATQSTGFGSGAFRDVNIDQNTYYVFSWNDNGASNISGFCAAPQNGAGSNGAFTANQTGWFSGTTTVLRVSSNRTSATWTGESALLSYRRSEPSIAANNPTAQTICTGQSVSIAGGAATFGTRYWQASTSLGTSTATPSTPNGTGALSPSGTYNFYYRPNNGGCWGNQQTTVVTVDPAPVASATPTSQSFCSGSSTSISLSSSLGGTTYAWTAVGSAGITGFSGGSTSVIAQTLSNATTSQGTVTYTITPTAAGCPGASIQVVVTVNPIPNAIATPTSQPICSGGLTSIVLTSGVTGSTFSWTASGTVGTSGFSDASGNNINQVLTNATGTPGTVTYTVTPTANGCSGSPITVPITVNPLPATSFATLGGPYCINENAPISLVALGVPTPPPGTGNFSGTGVSGTDFVPSLAAVGSNTLTYTYTDANGCVGTAQQTVQVTGLPLVSFSGLGTSYCIDNTSPVALTGFPSGGTFSGPGIAGNNFTPSVAGVGLHNIIYTYTDINGCVNSQALSVNVFGLPNVGIFGLNASYCVSDAALTISGFPPGGTFSGTGVSGNQFNPAAATVGGPYTISYFYTDGNTCSNTATAQVTVNGVTAAEAGTGGSACDLDFQLGAVPSTGIGTWSQSTGPGSTVFAPNANDANAVATVSVYGTYTFTWTEVNGACSSSDQVIVNYYQQSTADAGIGGTECDLNFALNAIPTSGTGLWTLGSGPGTASFSNSASANATVSVSQSGTYVFTWTETNGSCVSSDQVSVQFLNQPVSNAGPNANACDLDILLAATASAGNGLWTVVSGPGNALFTNATSANSLVTVDAYGTYQFQWEETNGICVDAAMVTINFFEQPVADAGFGGLECDLDFQLMATASIGAGTWTYAGPGVATFTPDANDANTVVSVSTLGAYTFTWTVVSGTCSTSDAVTVTFQQQTAADAGNGGDACNLFFTFNGTNSFGNGAWTANGPGTAFYTNDNSAASSVTVDTYGTYIFTWTETSGSCITSDQITVNFFEQPIADAGQGGDACDLDFAFNATASAGSGTWTQTTGLGTAAFDNASSPSAIATVNQYGTYTFTWTETNGICTDSETITVNYFEQPVANAGVGGNECDLDFDLAAIATVGNGAWTQTSGPGIASFIDPTAAINTVTVDAYGTYLFTWTETNGTCTSAADVTVNFYQQPLADAGTDGDACNLAFTFNGVTSAGIGLWTQTSGLGSAVFGNSASATSTVTVDQNDTYTFTWTETNGTCTDSDVVSVNFWNQPTADAGQGGNECDLDFDLNAIPSLGSGEWTQTSGPGTSIFVSETSANTPVTVDAFGTYTYAWTETNGTCVSSDVITVTYTDQPAADAGQGGSACVLNFALNASLTNGTGLWTLASGAGFVNFVPSANDPNATVQVSQYGTYSFTWTESNGLCSDSETIVVDFYLQPTANAGVVADQCDLDITLAAVASAGMGNWTYTGPGTATFTPSINAATATAIVDQYGTYAFTWAEDNGGCTDAATVSVTFNQVPVASFNGLELSYCSDQQTPVLLTGVPAGGVFTGLGISGNFFVPTIADVGTHAITYTFTDGNGCDGSATQNVDVNAAPTVSFAGLAPEYCSDDAALQTLAGSPSGGVFSGAGITGNDFVAADAGSGTHVVTYTFTDPLGCPGTAQQTVVVNPLPVVTIAGLATEYCVDGAVVSLAGSPVGGTFTGTGISGSTFSPTFAGVGVHGVTYTYTNANGCTNTATISVTVHALPQPVIAPSGAQQICAGNVLELNAGAGFAAYSWSSGQTGQTISVTAANAYTVTVTSTDGCIATSAPVQVTVNQLPVVNLGNDTTICAGTFLTLNAGNPGLNYNWSTLEITQQIIVGTANTYNVQVTDANGCIGMDAIVVAVGTLTEAEIIVTGPTTFCAGESVVLVGPSNANYAWSTGETTQVITVTTGGPVSLVATDASGCTSSSSAINIVVNPLPNAVIVPNGNTTICQGGSVTLSAGGGTGIYSWAPGGQSTSSITVSTLGFYTLTITDPATGCATTSAPITVVVNQGTTPTIVAGGPLEFCNGGSVQLSVLPLGAFTAYDWTSGQTSQSITVTTSGDYAVVVTDINGCVNNATLISPLEVTVWTPSPVVQQFGNSLFVTNGPFASYQWLRNGNPIPGAAASEFTPSLSGNYTVVVMDGNGCEGTSSNIEFTFQVGIDDVGDIYGLSIYPNPNAGIFTLEADLGGHGDVTLLVRDIMGRELMQPERILSASAFRRTFNISHLANGIYYVQVSGEAGITVKQIIKQ